MSPIAENDQRAKVEIITVFFSSLKKKAAYLEELQASKHSDEARILCSCYIDWLALAMYWPDSRTNFNYVRSLREHSGDMIFSHVHPKMLEQALTKLSEGGGKKWAVIHAKVSDNLMRVERRLYGEHEIMDMMAPMLEPAETQGIRRELWRGTFAAIVYDRFRVASVHGFGPPDNTTFDGTTFQGQPMPAIDFFMVYDCLKKIIMAAKRVSIETGKWFGHDYEPRGSIGSA